MDYISTAALANELDIKSSDLFDKLKTLGWIERKNDKWTLLAQACASPKPLNVTILEL